MLTREKIENLRRFSALYASIEQEKTVLKYLSIIYIKYVSEAGIGMHRGEDFSVYAKVMKFFSNFESYPEEEIKLIVERLSEKAGYDMHFLLFHFNKTVMSWLVQNIDYKNLPGWNLSELNGEERINELRDITEAVNMLSSMYYGYNRLGTACNAVYSIASKLLNVKASDTFADFAYGQGVSTFLITNGAAKKYILSDISANSTVLILAALYGINEIEIERKPLESTMFQPNIADKIFIDPPLSGATLSEKTAINGIEVRETTSASILRVVESLKKEGIGIVTTTGRTLVGTTPALMDIKQQLINQRLLKAVITLPPCWIGTSVKTNLLVISKEENEGVVFVDVSASKVTGITWNDLIDSEGQLIISKIIEVVKNKTTKENISQFVLYEDINGVNITPVYYLNNLREEEPTSIIDIDNRLSQIYSEMTKIIGDMKFVK